MRRSRICSSERDAATDAPGGLDTEALGPVLRLERLAEATPLAVSDTQLSSWQ